MSGTYLHPPSSSDVARWSPSLLATCRRLFGDETELEEPPVPLELPFGRAAFTVKLVGREAQLEVRLDASRAALERQAAAMRVAASVGALQVLAVEEAVPAGSGDGSPLWMLVADGPAREPLPQLIGFNLPHVEALLRGFALSHRALHDLVLDRREELSSIPVVEARAELARIDSRRYPRECRWLAEHCPAGGRAVLCHGNYQPGCVWGPPASRWDEHGGPGRGLTISNWAGAVIAPPEFDVSFTLVAFWLAPYFAQHPGERAAIKMIRNTLLTMYQHDYPGFDELDKGGLRFWPAFHCLRGMAILDGSYDSRGTPFESQDEGPLPAELRPELERRFRQVTRQP